MATLRTKCDIDQNGTQKTRIWKSLTLATGDVLVTGFKDVWMVWIQDGTKWSTPGWTVSSGSVTFTLGGAYTGRVVVFGR